MYMYHADTKVRIRKKSFTRYLGEKQILLKIKRTEVSENTLSPKVQNFYSSDHDAIQCLSTKSFVLIKS